MPHQKPPVVRDWTNDGWATAIGIVGNVIGFGALFLVSTGMAVGALWIAWHIIVR